MLRIRRIHSRTGSAGGTTGQAMDPSVSVIIPAFNAETFLEETLDSVLSQTFDDYEIIVVDDGSTDRTPEVLKRYDTSIHSIRTVNRGPSHARNTGIRAAGGCYVAFLDADDLWTPDKLALQIDFLEARPHIDLVFADMLKFNRDRIVMPSYFQSLKNPAIRRKIMTEGECLSDATSLLMQCNVIPTGTVVLRRTALRHSGLFDENISNVEDLDLWIRLSFTSQIACLPDVLKKKREHDTNISKNRLKALEAAVHVFEKYQKDFPQVEHIHKPLYKKRLSWQYFYLGCYFFSDRQMKNARTNFRKSMKCRMSKSSLIYFLASFLPVKRIDLVKSMTPSFLKKKPSRQSFLSEK
jgi:glycosyltransferase involved in cell wall biosynthesis